MDVFFERKRALHNRIRKMEQEKKTQGNANRGEFLKSDISRVPEMVARDFQSETGVILSIQGV